MTTGLHYPEHLLAVKGVMLAAGSAGLYRKSRPDLVLMGFAQGSSCAAVFTTNQFCAAPVQLARNHLSVCTTPGFFVVNAGNANAGTGPQGYRDALEICRHLAGIAGCKVEEILPFSTGVIGEFLPVAKLCRGLTQLHGALEEDNWLDCSRAIMTTDTVPKGCSRRITLGDEQITITGIAKGSGMIRPDMATMLAFLATDAGIHRNLLQEILHEAVNRSFNRITVDGDTSTNDACVMIATGMSKAPGISPADSASLALLQEAVNDICISLAQSIVRDGEGATKFIAIEVTSGSCSNECLKVAYAIAESPLVKTAFYASDPNWGRILAAIGRAGTDNLDISKVAVYLDEICIVRNGMRADTYTEEQGKHAMAGAEIKVRVELGRGYASETIWTCDLSHEYITINSEYRS
jgi:glutamate N-acetyltransferase/amino-acid N-acetyltransferase